MSPNTSTNLFSNRHIGVSPDAQIKMLKKIGVHSLDQLIDATVPAQIRLQDPLNLPEAMTESEVLVHMRTLAQKNEIRKTYIGMGYFNCFTPPVIQRNIFENPGWYTQYTPYQAEISQGRLEALFNFQTVVSDLTGLPIANASLLDEATAAAEAMCLLLRSRPETLEMARNFLLVGNILPQVVDVILTRAKGVEINVVSIESLPEDLSGVFGVLIAYPDAIGQIENWEDQITKLKEKEIGVAVCTDLLALTLLTPPGEWGADICIGSAQRFGVPLGYGGPHAAFIATKEKFTRGMPGRIIGLSKDLNGDAAYRMALQTREQHIRREKATSNICTAQALLAIMAGMYAVYHGPAGLKEIAEKCHQLAMTLSKGLKALGLPLCSDQFFDTVCIAVTSEQKSLILKEAELQKINLGHRGNKLWIALDETTTAEEILTLMSLFEKALHLKQTMPASGHEGIPKALKRKSAFCTQVVFNTHRSESQMLRYIKRLENKDLSLTTSMIPLGSCTMKLNATVQMMPLSWPEFGSIHPFVPISQAAGYQALIQNLESYLSIITGFSGCSLQPNSGAQGEYAGLLSIQRYHESRQEFHRNVVLIPASAHGTNPATASLSGMKTVVVKCDQNGNIDLVDLKEKAEKYKDSLAAMMLTYPSTHGVFETTVKEVCALIHQNGGQVYMDGANMNAQVGLTNPYEIGADVCHLNLHKTFAIPHGGGGPGMGPICVREHLKPFLPQHWTTSNDRTYAVSAAPWGSASILIISYLYIRLLGESGLTLSTKTAILNANYIKARLEKSYDILYTGEKGHVAHELIIDLRSFKKSTKIEPEDIAKRVMDYGFHAPTISFPVAGTIMIEPTESEDQDELDRFCDALLRIREEIQEIADGKADTENNLLKNAPHTAYECCGEGWSHPYSRTAAAFPLPYIRSQKFWPSVKRIDNAYGDRNLICTCAPLSEYETIDA